MKVVEVSNLSFSYTEEFPALQQVSFEVKEGDYLAIIGHNGSGKSTLAKILMGLINDFEGSVSLFGKKLDKDSLTEIRKKVGIVFQNPDNQFVGATVADDIAFGLENRQIPHDEMPAIIKKYSEETGMAEFLDREPESLSGGQKQRVAIAGVLAMNPELIILDEATAMLDPRGKADISRIIANMKINNPRMTIISITHDVEEASLADKVMVLNSGKLVLYGEPKEVFSHEDTLKSIQLDVPFFQIVTNGLKEKVIEVPNEIKTIEQLEDYLCR